MQQENWKLIDATTGEPAVLNTQYQDFRGNTHVLNGGRPPHKPSSTGKVWTDKGEFFPSVIGLKWAYYE